MLIECPFCKARAQLAESKEGAKVRCGECGRVYGARPVGQKRSSSSSTNPVPFIIGGVVLLTGALLFFLTNNDEPPRTDYTERIEQEDDAPVVLTGFDAPEVQAAVKLHQYAKAGDRTPLTVRLAGEQIWSEQRAEDDPAWDDLDSAERNAFLGELVDELIDTEFQKSPANWTPYNGHVVSEDRGIVTVEVQCTPVGGGVESLEFTWRVVQDGERYEAVSWSRFEEPEVVEPKKGTPKSLEGVEVVELSTGGEVTEREPEPLEHLATTPPDLRAEIDELYAMLLDLSLTKEMSAAKLRLQEIGKPAIPRLLTGLYEVELTDIDTARQIQNIVSVLRKITDENFGFEPLVMVGSNMGTTEELRTSAIKQWFAWWYRFGDSFTEPDREDNLGDYIELSESDKKWLERNKDN